MEYLDGFSLQSLVDRFGPQPDGRVIGILLQVCGSLMEAHALGLIHRDIKPANIMVTQRGGIRDFAKLLDFGLVKAVDAHKQTMLTAADSITGTPLYMSPESIQDPDEADARSDLYSLGAVGYFLLTGVPVFSGVNVMEIIRHQLESQPVGPTKRLGSADVARLGTSDPGLFGQVSERSAAKRCPIGRRPQSLRSAPSLECRRRRPLVDPVSTDTNPRSRRREYD